MATDDNFSEAVYAYLAEDDAAGTRARAMAGHFEVAVSTTRRWADGVARPHPRIKKQILRYIAEQSDGEGDLGGEG